MERKLGLENAKKVLKAFGKDSQHFGFINVSEDELANLTSLYSPHMMQYRGDVFSFRAGGWVVLIILHDGFVEISMINPYDVGEDFFVTADI